MRIFTRQTSTPRGKLAIVVPSYRFDARARHSLASSAALASEEIAVMIADNSESPDKWEFLSSLARLHSNIHIFRHRTNIGASRNWQFLIDKTSLEYCLSLADDDFCTPLYAENALALLERHADAVAAAGPFIMIGSNNSMTVGNSGRAESSAVERCIGFRIGGGNSLPSSVTRRSALLPFIAYVKGHPLKASFFDWIYAYWLLGQGKYYTENKGFFFYDCSNWESGEAYWRNNAKFYVEAGLPETFTLFHELYWAVELAHFFRGGYSPISNSQESAECARFFYLDRMREFRRSLEHVPRARALEDSIRHRAGSIEALRLLVWNDDALHPRLFDWFSEIVAAFDPVCATAYADFARASIERAEISRGHSPSH
jgi:glycosyl transferase family 2